VRNSAAVARKNGGKGRQGLHRQGALGQEEIVKDFLMWLKETFRFLIAL